MRLHRLSYTALFTCLAAVSSLSILGGCSPVEAGGGGSVHQRSYPIIGGSVEDGMPEVVSIGNGGGFCSGTLVAPRLVYTAGHCVGTGEAEDLTVYIGPGPMQDAGTRLVAERTVSHPDKDLSNPRDPRHDVGVIYLVEDAPIEPLAVSWESMGNDAVGLEPLWVGFGYAGVGEPPRVKRSAWIAIAGVGESWFYGTDEGGQTACSGDSGGAVVQEGPNGLELIGIIHGSGEACEEGSVATRIDTNSEFLTEHLLAAGGTIDPPTGGGCQLGADHIGPAAPLLLLLLLGRVRRARRRHDA